MIASGLRMKLLDFRIENFRSIADTGWRPFSGDGITVLIGQNESGKSSILAALEKVFSNRDLEDDDLRIVAPHPKVSLRISLVLNDLIDQLEGFAPQYINVLHKFLSKNKGIVEFSTEWAPQPPGSKDRFSVTRRLEDTSLSEMLSRVSNLVDSISPSAASDEGAAIENDEEDEQGHENANDDKSSESTKELTAEDVAEAIYYAGPETVLFDEETGLLPNKIDILKSNSSYKLSGNGSSAAINFLDIAGIDLDQLVNQVERARESILNRGNSAVTSHFANFWSQTIGKKDRLYLKCDLKFHDSNSATPGRPYLVFWISDGQNHLYPKQRSTGVRWFLSFYLQLMASDKASSGSNTFFLLDEPGANLHERAQSDVLRLINKLSDKRQIMYSTHSPHMIEYDKLFRVLAVQREGEKDDTPTTVIHAHRLGAASRDTLSPVLTAMGTDFSRQDVIKKQNNVILEEMSGYYYLRSFWHLTSEKQEVHFVAATGANNIEALANMFVGWGLGFLVAVDDDSTGRSVYNSMKRNMFGDDPEAANQRMLKIDGKGIEDIFDHNDFKIFILNAPEEAFTSDNSQYVKDARQSKAVLAYQFWNRVAKGEIKWKQLSGATREKISVLVREIASRLKNAADKQP
jgi:energy-coupling factor transporter ATP-binding protein EcfA2